mmetsp:Transcript_44285/g.56714  ORF Transcript_44285/g.56714 Transcript_44285/m.56714 type:complete len:314 (+) Transcript_44285:161-1102(+)
MQSSLEQSWSLTPVMSNRATQDLQLLLLLEDFKGSNFKSFSQPRSSACLALDRFFTRYDIRKQLQGIIVRQIQKGIVHHNKEMVYENESLKSELRILIGFAETSVAEQARILNTTTTELGFALAGCAIMNMVIDAVEGGPLEFLDSSDEEEEEESAEVYFRISIALETVDLADKDIISGHLCKTIGSGRMEWGGRRGESELERNLRNARVSFLTEDEQRESDSGESRDATPDVLLDEPIMVHGKRVHWIDSNTGFIIPGVSSAGEIQSYRTKAEKYIRLFGSGAFFWPKSGFCEGFLHNVDGLINIAPSSSSF